MYNLRIPKQNKCIQVQWSPVKEGGIYMSRSSGEIRRSINNLKNKLSIQNQRLQVVRKVSAFLEGAYGEQINSINSEINFLFSNLSTGISEGNSKHDAINAYKQAGTNSDSYLSVSIGDLSMEKSRIEKEISELKNRIASEESAYSDAVDRERREEEARKAAAEEAARQAAIKAMSMC